MMLAMPETTEAQPQIGQAATLLGRTDSHAATIVHTEGCLVLVRRGRESPTGASHWFRCGEGGTWEELRLNPASGRFSVAPAGLGLSLGD